MQTKDESPEQNPSIVDEVDSPPESGEVARRPREHATDVDLEAQLDRCASFFPTPDCLTDDEVLAFSEGQVSSARQAAIEWHMAGCGSCQQLVQWAAWDIDASLSDSAGPSCFTIARLRRADARPRARARPRHAPTDAAPILVRRARPPRAR